jgi:prepilin-type N-terminal cleavage/methylation domain-containing protein
MRRGFTLLELTVVLVLLGMLATLSGLALASRLRQPTDESTHSVERALAQAARARQAVAWTDTTGTIWRVLPDGRVLSSRFGHDKR